MSRSFAKDAGANPPGNGPVGGRRAEGLESPETSAVPDAADAIRICFDDDEPPALVFNARAQPGALVSWAWGQLTALDTLLRAMLERRSAGDDDAEVAAAVHTALVPVIGALAFSEQRAHELRCAREAPAARRGGKKRGARRRPHSAD